MKTTLIMIGIVAVALIFLIASSGVHGANSVRYDSSGIAYIQVSEESNYIIDTRFGLCFFETRTQNGLAVTEVDCGKFKGTVKGL